MDPAWPHLQLVYGACLARSASRSDWLPHGCLAPYAAEFLLRFIVSGEVKAKSAKKYIDIAFCSRLIEMFDSEGEFKACVSPRLPVDSILLRRPT